MLSSLFVLLAASAYASAAPTTANLQPRAEPNARRGYTNIEEYADFEDIASGTVLSTYKGLEWSGFQTTTLIDGIIPQDCPFFGPDRNTRCHYAQAVNARAKKVANLPTISAAAPATLIRLNYFSWAAGGPSYFGRGANLTVTGYKEKKNGHLGKHGASATFFYAASQNAGGTGASMVNVSLPADFGAYNAVVFNVTSDYSTDEPYLLLDDVDFTSYSPTK